ncbi:MAG: hypothetical protein RLZZ156_916 [Deinococcota bacterium]|jgi:hypothetical protein
MALSEAQILNRAYWIERIRRFDGDFIVSVRSLEQQLRAELDNLGLIGLIGHLELCGVIPESFRHDSSEEKLYSKYTDILLALAFEQLGLTSLVLTERADAADVECVSQNLSFVADAKAFRLSRTAKNQKDFKINSMHTWKRGKPFAMIVCPLYQLPSSQSQIYQQASTMNVCIFSYAHLVVLLRLVSFLGQARVLGLLHHLFQVVAAMNPSKDALFYWKAINLEILRFADEVQEIWIEEKENSSFALAILKNEALTHLANERERIMQMSRADAIAELLKSHNVDSRIQVITKVSSNQLFEVQQ